MGGGCTLGLAIFLTFFRHYLCRSSFFDIEVATQPAGMGLGAMERKNFARAMFRVKAIGESCLHARGFIAEGKRVMPGWECLRQTGPVLVRLNLHAYEGRTNWLCFDDSCSFSIYIKKVVSVAVARHKGKFADGYAPVSVNVGGFKVLNIPASSSQHLIDFYPCFLFGVHNGRTFLLSGKMA